MEIMCHSHVNVIDIPTMYLQYDFYETAVEFLYNSIEFLGISVSFPIDFYRNFMEISMQNKMNYDTSTYGLHRYDYTWL